MQSDMSIGIVGTGPAGIFAALAAAERGAHVLLFDTNEIVGRKLLVTGNGRCNITNLNVRAERYVCSNPSFTRTALGLIGATETRERLRELGIPTYATSDGWCYPLSDSAATVADTLSAMLRWAGVELHLKTKISDLAPIAAPDGDVRWRLTVGGGPHNVQVDRVIVATGGKAYPALGSKGELFPVLARLGHRILPVQPALVPLTTEVRPIHRLQGVRLDVKLRILQDDALLGETAGNLLFTDTGLSGPAAMDLSYLISDRSDAELYAEVDLIANTRDALEELLRRRRYTAVPLRVVLGAVLPVKVPPVLLELGGLDADALLADVEQVNLARVLHLASHLRLRVTGTRSFQHAQLSTGGVSTDEVAPETMASRLHRGLYLAGEVLDVMGPCGGYNLQFAFTSGALAGMAAAASNPAGVAARYERS